MHWARVHRFGALLADHAGLPASARVCVELFAWLHDLAREDDEGGSKHAVDGAAQIDDILPSIAGPLVPDQIETLRVAILNHSDGMVAARAFDAGAFEGVAWTRDLVVATVGCCWDADRLDLPRVGMTPVEPFMSTPAWREVLLLSNRIHAAGATSAGAAPTTYDPSGEARRRAYQRHAESGESSAIEIKSPDRRGG